MAAQKAAIGMIFLMSIVFSLSFGPVSWVLASEVSRTSFQSCIMTVLTEGPPGISHPDALHRHECCYVYELVFQRGDFRNVTNRDGQRRLEILSTLRLSECSGLYHHRGILPRNKRQVPPEVSYSRIVLTYRIGKSLEEMAVIFGDEVDVRQWLREHLDRKEDHLEKA